MTRFDEIKEQHEATLVIDWTKEFDPEWQPNSLSNAEQCHKDRGELIQILKVIEDELGDTENDYAPDEPPIAVAELIERLREALK